MSTWNKRTILTSDVQAHPAIAAWERATSLAAAPASVHVLFERGHGAVYWLPDVAPGGASVFAKRAFPAATVVERTIYRDVLPHLPLTAPRYFGSWVDDENGWLFVEDVGRDRYLKTDPEHLALAARWIATLHLEGAQVAAARSLPDGGPARYLKHLRIAHEKTTRSIRLWRYTAGEAEQLAALLRTLDAIAARWCRVEAALDGAPSTVVHGDFRPKNGYLRRNEAGLSLLPIDWETAGWGSPAADLTRIDLRTYWSVVRDGWSQATSEDVVGWRRIGLLLESLAAADWESETLHCAGERARRCAVDNLKSVRSSMIAAATAAGILGD